MAEDATDSFSLFLPESLNEPNPCPLGLRLSDGTSFNFGAEKSAFILGSALDADFVVKNQTVSKKHLSFSRDIYGVSLQPFWGQKTLVNGQEVHERKSLKHHDSIKVGAVQMIYYELEEENRKKVPIKPKDSRRLLKIFDRIFIVAFLVVSLGFLWQLAT